MSGESSLINILKWDGDGFQPLVSYGEWLVAFMNWEQRFDINYISEVERHNQTDEDFVLIHGRSVLFVLDDSSMQIVDMQPGVIYNVPAGTWHNVIGTRETQWLIVESNDTSEENSDYRDLENDELAALRSQFPSWLK